MIRFSLRCDVISFFLSPPLLPLGNPRMEHLLPLPPPFPLTVLKIRGLPTVPNEVSTLLSFIIYVLNKRVILNNREYLFPRGGQNIYAHISFL